MSFSFYFSLSLCFSNLNPPSPPPPLLGLQWPVSLFKSSSPWCSHYCAARLPCGLLNLNLNLVKISISLAVYCQSATVNLYFPWTISKRVDVCGKLSLPNQSTVKYPRMHCLMRQISTLATIAGVAFTRNYFYFLQLPIWIFKLR